MLRKMTRFPRKVFGEGQEPDARFSLANERTFLAWIRTSMALLAGGVALQIVDLSLQRDLRMVTSLGLVTLGLFCAVWSFLGWQERSGLSAGTKRCRVRAAWLWPWSAWSSAPPSWSPECW
jgi:uncharacterized membrane protein YidH (DUF202 family)